VPRLSGSFSWGVLPLKRGTPSGHPQAREHPTA
jgi:hypothetical protein